MAAFRILNQNPVYFDNDNQPCANGFLYFYQTGTTTPLATYSDVALSSPNANPVELDANGRAISEIYGDGTYRVVLKDADAVTIWTRDNVTGGAVAGQTIPAGDPDQFLTTDGDNLSFVDIRQVPDPAGSGGKILSTDGTNTFWITKPADGEDGAPGVSDVAVTATSLRAGTFFIQFGTGTASATGTASSSASVIFGTAFTTLGCVMVMAKTNTASSPWAPVVANVTVESATGFTVIFDPAEGGSNSGSVVNSVPFSWVAFGVKS